MKSEGIRQTMNAFAHTFKTSLLAAAVLSLTACGGDDPSFSLDSSNDSFQTATSQSKIDILWVIDNSGSMSNSQSELVNEFNSFISDFVSKSFDFQMGVTTTDAYRAHPDLQNDPSRSDLKDGAGGTNTGVFVVTPSTPNLTSTFITNVTQGTSGHGDERAFHSFYETLNNANNSALYRGSAESFLSIIVVSDEEDHSHSLENGNANGRMVNHIQNNNDAEIDSLDFYKNYLNTLTNSANAGDNYSVSALAIYDNACASDPTFGGGKIASRYADLANDTGGVAASLCDSFATSLASISGSILQQATKFKLNVIPDPATIQVVVNGSIQASGWAYDAATNSIVFDANNIPPAGASINVTFDPAGFQE